MEIAKLVSNGRDRHWAVVDGLEMGLMFVTSSIFFFFLAAISAKIPGRTLFGPQPVRADDWLNGCATALDTPLIGAIVLGPVSTGLSWDDRCKPMLH